MQDRPTAAEAVAAVADFLANDVGNAVSRPLAYQVRVAQNLLRIVERELRLAPGADARERERLRALLGRDGDLAELNRELAARLRARSIDDASRELLDHLCATARDRLEIASPGYADAEVA